MRVPSRAALSSRHNNNIFSVCSQCCQNNLTNFVIRHGSRLLLASSMMMMMMMMWTSSLASYTRLGETVSLWQKEQFSNAHLLHTVGRLVSIKSKILGVQLSWSRGHCYADLMIQRTVLVCSFRDPDLSSFGLFEGDSTQCVHHLLRKTLL
jgi:hypothetical protein